MAPQAPRNPEAALAIAQQRIADEAARQTGALDLSGLGLDLLPDSLFALTHLRSLDLGNPDGWGDSSKSNRIDAQRDQLGRLTRLETLSVAYTDLASLFPLRTLTSLVQFDCSGNKVSDLAPLAGCATLQTLNCSGTKVNDLAPLAGCATLQTLNCSYTKVSDLAPLAGCATLQILNCFHTKVSDLAPLAGCEALQELNCSSTEVSDLAPLAGCQTLRTLDCYNTKVSDLALLAGCATLQILNCFHTEVSDLAPLAGCEALQKLNCSWTTVSDLAPLAGCETLQTLNCSYTKVSDLVPLAGCETLQTLHCSYTKVSDLAPLAGCEPLLMIDCSHTEVSDLAPLAGCETLQTLDCSRTKVSDLAPLAGCKTLMIINCSDTKVSDLAPLATCTALQQLACSGCQLLFLPTDLLALPALFSLLLRSRVVGMPPAGVLSTNYFDNCLDRVRAHFADLAAGAEEILSVKLLLLGNGGVGKTQIARRLTGQPFAPDWDSTHGIEVGGVVLPGDPAIRLHIWDFGGQDIYHGAHALFLTSPAILAVVWSMDGEGQDTHRYGGLEFRNQPLPYWIDVARHQGHPDSPLLILQTQCDQPGDDARRFPLPDAQLDDLPYVQTLCVSAKTGRRFANLMETLSEAVAWLRAPERLGQPQIGAGRLRVQRRLEALRDADQRLPARARRHRLLSLDDFAALCAEEGGVSAPEHLLTYLDADGTILYRPGLFTDRVVLDQNWALEAVYAVFERANGALTEIRRANGRFTQALLARLVWREHDAAERALFIDLMRSCGVCFLHRTYDDGTDEIAEYIAPDLLPTPAAVADHLAGRWEEGRAGETALFRYPLLHGGLIRTIMATVGERAGPDALYWQGGLWGYETTSGSRLRIEQTMTGPWQGDITVRTQGGRAAELLGRLIELVERAQQRLGLRPSAMERSTMMDPMPETAEMRFAQEKPAQPEWYVSYAWGDKTREGKAREKLVDRLCAAAEARGRKILRDNEVLGLGERISAFMRRIGGGDRVFVILSDKYLRSPHCLFELSEIWRTSRQEGPAFLERVRVYALPDATIWTPLDRVKWGVHWKEQHDALDAIARAHGVGVLGESGSADLRLTQRFYTQVTDILGTLTDIVQPRSFEQLEQYGFGEDDAAGSP
ncbi:COR domain-containing protein [Azospirillum sp.]|uniref:COR domain-containing protein n=1 Tax=Azospirillum sp. TaxID=34012 RepID=UPI0026200FE8|nr:COR domain-containing protein [Azospirillum sp.]